MATGVAVRVQSAGTLPDPLAAASTTLARVSLAGWSVLVIVQIGVVPRGQRHRAGTESLEAAPVHVHCEAV